MNQQFVDSGYDLQRFEKLTYDWLTHLNTNKRKDDDFAYFMCGEVGMLKVIGIYEMYAMLPIYIINYRTVLDNSFGLIAYQSIMPKLKSCRQCDRTVEAFLRLWWQELTRLYYRNLYGKDANVFSYITTSPSTCHLDELLESSSLVKKNTERINVV